MPIYDIFDLLHNFKLRCLIGSVLGSESSEFPYHGWYPRKKLKGDDILSKIDLVSFPPTLTLRHAITGTNEYHTFFPLLKIFKMLLEDALEVNFQVTLFLSQYVLKSRNIAWCTVLVSSFSKDALV